MRGWTRSRPSTLPRLVRPCFLDLESVNSLLAIIYLYIDNETILEEFPFLAPSTFFTRDGSIGELKTFAFHAHSPQLSELSWRECFSHNSEVGPGSLLNRQSRNRQSRLSHGTFEELVSLSFN